MGLHLLRHSGSLSVFSERKNYSKKGFLAESLFLFKSFIKTNGGFPLNAINEFL